LIRRLWLQALLLVHLEKKKENRETYIKYNTIIKITRIEKNIEKDLLNTIEKILILIEHSIVKVLIIKHY